MLRVIGGQDSHNETFVTFNSTSQIQHNFTILPALVSDDFVPSSVDLGLSLNSTNKIWEFIGRYFYMLLWLHVADLGQIAPTPTNDTMTYDFSASENIFVNDTLYIN